MLWWLNKVPSYCLVALPMYSVLYFILLHLVAVTVAVIHHSSWVSFVLPAVFEIFFSIKLPLGTWPIHCQFLINYIGWSVLMFFILDMCFSVPYSISWNIIIIAFLFFISLFGSHIGSSPFAMNASLIIVLMLPWHCGHESSFLLNLVGSHVSWH